MEGLHCRFELLAHKTLSEMTEQDGVFRFITEELQVTVNARTGWRPR